MRNIPNRIAKSNFLVQEFYVAFAYLNKIHKNCKYIQFSFIKTVYAINVLFTYEELILIKFWNLYFWLQSKRQTQYSYTKLLEA